MDKTDKPAHLDELAKLIESDQVNAVDLQLIENTIETLLQYFKSRANAASGANQVIDIRTGKSLKQQAESTENTADKVEEMVREWTFDDVRLFKEQMKDCSETTHAVMAIFTQFPIGTKLNTATLYDAARKRGIRRPQDNHRLISRDFTVSTINKCGMRKLYGSEGPFILKRNKPLGDKRRDDLNPLLFWIEKV